MKKEKKNFLSGKYSQCRTINLSIEIVQLTLLSLRIPRCDDDDDDNVEFNGNVLYCICCGRICKLREEYEFLAAELSREPCCEPCCEPLLDTGPSVKKKKKNQ